ncbi:MAG: sulfate transporter CysZ [Reinekea sp.]
MIKQFFEAITAVLQAFPLLFSRRLRLFVFAPIVANTVLMGLIVFVAFGYIDSTADYLMGFLPDWFSFLHWLFYLIFAAIMLLLMFYSFSIGVNIIAAPFMALLAEKTEEITTGKLFDEAMTLRGFIKIIGRSIKREIQKLIYFLPRFLGLLLLSFVPVVNLVSSLLLLLFSAWMLALQYMDYAFDNNQLSFRSMRQMLKRKLLLCWSFGFIVMIGMTIPLLNLIIMPLAVVASTLLWNRVFNT